MLFEDKVSSSYYQFDSTNQDIYLTKSAAFSPSTVAEVTITISQIKDVYYRNYYKFQNLAADLGGILKIVIMIFLALNQLISSQVLKSNIYDSLFVYFDEEYVSRNKVNVFQTKNRNVDDKACENIIINNLNKSSLSQTNTKILHLENNYLQNIIPNHEENNKKEEKMKKMEKTQNIKINSRNILCYCFLQKSKKNKLKYSKKSIDNFLDIRNFIQKINQIEIMKRTLYNQEQIKKIENINFKQKKL